MPSISSGDREFRVPDSYPLNAAGTRVADDGSKFVKVKGVRWFTNIDHGRRHESLQLMTMDDNIVYNKRLKGEPYQRYDNYDAIEIPFTNAIPNDFDGMMGVPISFLDRYAPEQFMVLGITKTWDDPSGLKAKIYPTQTQISKKGVRSKVGKLNDGATIKVSGVPAESTYYEVDGQLYVQPYVRILIRHKNPAPRKAD